MNNFTRVYVDASLEIKRDLFKFVQSRGYVAHFSSVVDDGDNIIAIYLDDEQFNELHYCDEYGISTIDPETNETHNYWWEGMCCLVDHHRLVSALYLMEQGDCGLYDVNDVYAEYSLPIDEIDSHMI